MPFFKFRTVFFLFLYSGTLSLLLTCIERDNPWDPVNYREEGCTDRYIHQIDSITHLIESYDTTLVKQDSLRFKTLKQTNLTTRDNNASLRKNIEDKLRESNKNFKEDTAADNCETARLRDSIKVQLLRLDKNVTTENIGQAIAQLTADSTAIENRFSEAENLCAGQKALTPSYHTLITRQYPEKKAVWQKLISEINTYSNAINDSNRTVDSLNEVVRVYDSFVNHYNDSLNACKIIRTTDPDTIGKQLDSIQPGDTIALGEGIITGIQINIVDKGNNDDMMVIMGVPGGKTVIESSTRLHLETVSSIIFKHLIFNHTASIQIKNDCSNVTFDYCTFNGNPNHGIEALHSSNLKIENCRFIDNCTTGKDTSDTTGDQWAALRLSECLNVILKNILVARTSGYGVEIDGSTVTINKVTITDNTLDGIFYKNSDTERQCFIGNSIFSFNGGYGIICQNENSALSASEASENRYFQNTSGPMGGNEAAIESNGPFTISIDPMYTDTIDYQTGNPKYTGIGYNKTP